MARERMLSGAERIVVERWRQVYVLGWTAAHDAMQPTGHLLDEARRYLIRGTRTEGRDAIEPLTKAAAMIAAEIDRLQDHDDE